MLNVLKALLDAVITGTCFSGSHARIERCKSLSSAGDLSTMYDIHACLTRLVRVFTCLDFARHTSLALFVTWRSMLAISSNTTRPAILTGRIHGPCSPPNVSVLFSHSAPNPPSSHKRRTWQFLLQVLKILVAVAVNAHEGSSLGVACPCSVSLQHLLC